MLRLWSARHKFNTWRKIWLAVAEAQHELTKDQPTPLVTKEQLEELRAVVNRPGGITDAEIRAAEKYERELRHDVMAHVHALGDSCPKAKGIIHLGMTSQDVVCNADLLIIAGAMSTIERKLARLIIAFGERSGQFRNLPTLAFTHYQPAQPTTVGRRIAMWTAEVHLGYMRLQRLDGGRIRGLRGATGTQASYLHLMDGSADAVDLLEADVIQRLVHGLVEFSDDEGWEKHRRWMLEHYRKMLPPPREYETQPEWATYLNEWRQQCADSAEQLSKMTGREYRLLMERDLTRASTFSVPGQTYPRVIDTFILADLASTASVLHKIATDIRLLCNRKELDEPFEDKQIGSSAMPYKRNPMRCERICGLTRFVMNLVGNAYDTAATQWLERTLDDSSNRRLSLPEAFLALDGALDLMHNVASGLVV
ncbi:MAG: lyase family protein [Planctomycetaceae bacterium]|nr:lyase family protein [Planctomycetaceae bacterium]